MARDEERRDREEAFGDAVYDTWMAGGNPDLVERGDVDDGWYETCDRYDAAAYATRRALRRS